MRSEPMQANTRRVARFCLCFLGASLQTSGLFPQEKPFPVFAGELSVIWEVEGSDPYCSFTPPESPEHGFFFNDFSRWWNTATDPAGLVHGDPSTLTWGFIGDGTAIGDGGCGVLGETAPSDLIALLDSIRDPASTGGTDLTQRLWFPVFQQIFTDWGLLNGVNYVYEPNDDGAALVTGGSGVLGTRADLRIGGHSVDGQSGSNILACNYFPPNGDMILDTDNTTFYSGTANNSRGTRNVLAHEHGHGMGINHVCPINQTKLMEPFISTAFDGPQVDDINAANRGYGDRDEFPGQNDTSGTATSLGAIPKSGVPTNRTNLSVDSTTDSDFYSFSASQGSQATVTLTPTGSTYLNGPQNPNGSCTVGTNFDSLAQSDLAVEIRGQSGANVLGSADANGAGFAETITDVALPEGAGTYFVRTSGLNDFNQMYDLSVSLSSSDADLAIAKADSVDPVFTGATLTYTITALNNGPGTATGVTVTETLPAGVPSVSTNGCTEDPNGIPTCTLGSINPGASKSYTATVTVTAGPGTISNTVGVASTSTDPNAVNDSATRATTVVAAPSCANDINLTAADNGASSGYGAKNSITTGGGFAVAASEKVNFTAGSFIAFSDDSTFDGEAIFVIDLSLCP